jgi:ATP-dependent DNA helicase RecG
VGTNFEPSGDHQRQPLEFWFAQRLRPSVELSFKSLQHSGRKIVLLEVPAAPASPVEFNRIAYIRIGSATPRLSDYPERLRALWLKLQPYAWEAGNAAQFLTGDQVLSRLDYVTYFKLLRQPLPDNRQGIFEKLEQDRIVSKDVGGHWNVSNLGAILFAHDLSAFDVSMARKAVRFTAYERESRASKVRHRSELPSGYASCFERLVDIIEGLLPHNEAIEKSLRIERPLFPSIAIRELAANALIHQDMTITGAGPQIELFSNRIEFTNPGDPLVPPDRFLDYPPRSRNEAMASLMRRMGFCEEEGTGIDKVLAAVDTFQLPPPDFRAEGNAMRVVFFAPRSFAEMSKEERVRACYQHACLKHVSGQKMRNSTLRERLGIDERNASQASAIIKMALAAGLIRPADPDRPQAAYVPNLK